MRLYATKKSPTIFEQTDKLEQKRSTKYEEYSNTFRFVSLKRQCLKPSFVNTSRKNPRDLT